MQSFVKKLADVPGIELASRPEGHLILVVEDSSPPAWAAWFTYHSDYTTMTKDNFHAIAPLDGVGGWKRVNSQQDSPPSPPSD